ncbi:hypothetical protein VV01_17965 [Luteipulveratus halotolerans]|uniref:histidine kinase n=1 Tax=Luteipulveratus halotolerans TaxID=1631356 RepID=A0A0L6CP93_9MICO|nr:hypothetical protein VV01_17965 [Luteipulveratus halotolerans]
MLLPLVFLLIGSALALSFASIDLSLWSVMTSADQPNALLWPVMAAVSCLPPTLIALTPAVRQVEATAVSTLLGIDFGDQLPGPARTWDQRWRTVTWFWMHLIAGAGAGALVVLGTVFAVSVSVQPFVFDKGDHVADVSWAVVYGDARDLMYPLGALVLVLVAVGALLLIIAVLRSLARPMLGQTVDERIAELDTRTTHLVERTRLARELHDSVGHALSVVVLQAAAARRRLATDPASAESSLSSVEEVANSALAELDEVLGLLRDEERPTAKRPLHDLASLSSLIGAVRGTGLDVETDLRESDLTGLAPVVSREAYRIVQEGLTNAMRHAPGCTATVRIHRRRGRLHIEVANPVAGQGSSSWRRRQGAGGSGLEGMRERCRILGGTADAGAHHGMWVLHAQLPLPASSTKETR